MNHHLTRTFATGTLLALASVLPAQIPLPDSDTFGSDGTPPPDWVNVQNSWTASGGVAVPQQVNYAYSIMRRNKGGVAYYAYDKTYPLVVSWDMKPDHDSDDGSGNTWFEILTPVACNYDPRAGANGSVGYWVQMGKNGTLLFYRDNRQWDGAGVLKGSAALGASYSANMHSHRIEVTWQGGTTAEFKIFVDNVLKITYTDPRFLPLYGWTASGDTETGNEQGAYTNFKVGFGRGHWPGSAQNPAVDNYSIEYRRPFLGTVFRFR